jgi:hypothetical protein
MSFEIDPEGKEKAELRQELESIDYHSMKKELDKRGIGSIWKAGMKKVDLVKQAFTKLNFIRKAKEEIGEEAEEEILNAKVLELEQEAASKKLEDKRKRTQLKNKGAQNIYNILLKRHLKNGVLDTDAIKAGLKEWSTGKSSKKMNATARVQAHKQVLKDFI